RRLGFEAEVLDHMRGCLADHVPDVVKAPASSPPADLLEVADRERLRTTSIVLEKLGEQYRPDRHVHADPERVGAADDFQKTLLGELLNKHPILRQQTRVMDADAVPQQFRHFLPVGAAEIRILESLGNALLLLAGTEVRAGQIPRGLGAGKLREMDEV